MTTSRTDTGPMELTVDRISRLLDGAESVLPHLRAQREVVTDRIEELQQLAAALDRAIEKKEETMSDTELRDLLGQGTDGLDQLARALRGSWGPDTCAPEDVSDWSRDNPARGQCANTALVVHDHFGGVLMCGEVQVAGAWVDFHWWNQLPDGQEVDLTREQFADHESVTAGTAVERPRCVTRMDQEYGLLRSRVAALLPQR